MSVVRILSRAARLSLMWVRTEPSCCWSITTTLLRLMIYWSRGREEGEGDAEKGGEVEAVTCGRISDDVWCRETGVGCDTGVDREISSPVDEVTSGELAVDGPNTVFGRRREGDRKEDVCGMTYTDREGGDWSMSVVKGTNRLGTVEVGSIVMLSTAVVLVSIPVGTSPLPLPILSESLSAWQRNRQVNWTTDNTTQWLLILNFISHKNTIPLH